jgi:hypothetical protein
MLYQRHLISFLSQDAISFKYLTIPRSIEENKVCTGEPLHILKKALLECLVDEFFVIYINFSHVLTSNSLRHVKQPEPIRSPTGNIFLLLLRAMTFSAAPMSNNLRPTYNRVG